MPHFSLFWKLEILFLAFSCLIVKCLVWLWEKLSCLWFVQLPEYVLSFCFCQIWRLLRCNVFEYAFMLILFSSFLKLWCYDWWYFCYGHIQIPEAPFCFLIFKKKKSEILISLVQIGWILLMCSQVLWFCSPSLPCFYSVHPISCFCVCLTFYLSVL